MKKSFIFSLFLVSGVFFLEPLISKEIVEDKNLIEKVSFDIWWEDKYNESVITLRTYPEDIKTIQVGNGRFINKNQVLEIYREVNKGSIFSSSSYIFNIVYKDENSKVSTGKIIFSNKRASKKFEKALVDFGFQKDFNLFFSKKVSIKYIRVHRTSAPRGPLSQFET